MPAELGSLSNLEWLYLSDNQLSGGCRRNWAASPTWTHLYLQRQPAERGDTGGTGQPLQPGVVVAPAQPVERGDTGGTGQPLQPGVVGSQRQSAERIPAELGSLSNLETLYLEQQPLTGPIPAELVLANNLERAYRPVSPTAEHVNRVRPGGVARYSRE